MTWWVMARCPKPLIGPWIWSRGCAGGGGRGPQVSSAAARQAGRAGTPGSLPGFLGDNSDSCPGQGHKRAGDGAEPHLGHLESLDLC